MWFSGLWIHYGYIECFESWPTIYNEQQSDGIWDHNGVFLVSLNIFVILMCLAECLVWQLKKRLNSSISRRSHGHWLKYCNVELKTALSTIQKNTLTAHIMSLTATIVLLSFLLFRRVTVQSSIFIISCFCLSYFWGELVDNLVFLLYCASVFPTFEES